MKKAPAPSAISTVTTRQGAMDVVLAAVVVALIGFGVVMVYSASTIEATVVFRDPQYFLKRQVTWLRHQLPELQPLAGFGDDPALAPALGPGSGPALEPGIGPGRPAQELSRRRSC